MTDQPIIPAFEDDPLMQLLVQMGREFIFNPTPNEKSNPRDAAMDADLAQITNSNNAPIAITCDSSHENAEKTADKFVSAYNETYGAGINPEAVGELLELVDEIDTYFRRRAKHGKWAIRLRAKTSAAIEKANL